MTSKGSQFWDQPARSVANTLRVVESLGNESFRVVALGAGSNVEILADQVARHLRLLFTATSRLLTICARAVRKRSDLPRILIGETGLVEVATHADADCVVSATVGRSDSQPTLRALEAGKRVALANKETLVMAGELMT